jgi:Spy/CpxP family protein refolding chaperone
VNKALTLIGALAVAAGAWTVGHRQGVADAPSIHAVEAERLRSEALWDQAFIADMNATPTERALFCDGVIDGARDLLDGEVRMEQEDRDAMRTVRD